MRISILILILLLVNETVAQEQRPENPYGRPTPTEDAPPPEPTEPLGGIVDALKKFIPAERPVEQPLDAGVPGESPEAQRKTLWDAATKLTAYEPSETDTAPQPTTPATSHAKDECLDPNKFQPGLAGFLDYYLFKIVETGNKEVYLAEEQGKQPFCLTNVDTEDLKKNDQVVVVGNVRARGTKIYKTAKGDKLTIRVVKLLSKEESEAVDAERALDATEHPMRAWTSKDGKHKIEARFVKFLGGKVHLVNKAGKAITISPNDLSLEDREYYRDLVKKAREETRKKDKEEDEDADDPEPF
jgi:hypothetical protein